MRRLEPPSAATWILEHLTPPDRDEALAGDLLEDFRSGRSDGWYWRQAFGACASGWVQYLRGYLRRRTQKAAAAAAAAEQASLAAQSGATMFLPKPDAWSVRKFFAFMLSAGLLNAWIAGLLLCRLPADHAPSLGSLFVRAIVYVAIAALAGTGGIWFYWSRSDSPLGADSPVSFLLFALTCAAAWIWMPAILLLAGQGSLIAIPIAILAAVLLAVTLRKMLPPMAILTGEVTSALDRPQRELFEQTLFTIPREAHGYAIALSIYAAGYMLTHYMTFEGSALLALAAFLFIWNWTLAPADAGPGAKKRNLRAARTLADVSLLAVLVTIYALMTAIDLRNTAEASAVAGSAATSQQQARGSLVAVDLSGYQSIILLPPATHQLIAPLPERNQLLAPGTKRPLIVHFDGQYWFMQMPETHPGPKAHQARGTPLGYDIASITAVPLSMEARQNLGGEIPLFRCRAIQVAVKSRVSNGAAVSMAVFLSDSTAPGSREIYLGQQPVISGEEEEIASNGMPAEKTLSFAVPNHGPIRHFDEVTVMFLTDPGHALVAPKIAIEQFALLPR